MAVGRLNVRAGKKGKASPHAMYIAREEKYAKPDDDLEKLEFVGVGNMPEWAKDKPNFFWKMSDEHERVNGTSYREHVISLPRELTPDQRHDLILDWIEQEIGDKHAYQYAIHNPLASDGNEQPHCHLMFCERELDGIERAPDQYFKRYNSKNPERGGAKKANTGMKPADRRTDLLAQRGRWEDTCNKHLELANSKARINMKSYKSAGINFTSLNYDMKDLQNPEVRQTQDAALTAKLEFRQALTDKKTINIRDEINKLNLAAAQQRRAAPTPKPTPTPKTAHEPEEPTRPIPQAAPVVIHTPIPTVELRSYTKTLFEGLHKHHDEIMNKVENDNVRYIADDKDSFFYHAENFSNQLSSEIDDKTLSRAELSAVLNAVASIMKNIDDIKSDDVPHRDSAVSAFNDVCIKVDAMSSHTPKPTPTLRR